MRYTPIQVAAYAVLPVESDGSATTCGGAYYAAAIVFGAILPTLVAWFLVAPLKRQPVAAGWKPKAMTIGPAVNACWGFGTALLYRVFDKIR